MQATAEPIITVRNLNVSFLMQKHGLNSLRDFIFSLGMRGLFEKRRVLHDINFEVYRGECLGILGRNGSGKSTLLRAIAGIMRPESGEVVVRGEPAPLMALGSGLEPELSGMENIRLIGTLMGFSSREIKNMVEPVAAFSELTHEELSMQVKRYSTGMMARLTFSIAISSIPEILIVDEALSVGDLDFRLKCAQRIREIKAAGSTILFVSHHIEEVKNICSRALFIEGGRIAMQGEVNAVCDYYVKHRQRERMERRQSFGM